MGGHPLADRMEAALDRENSRYEELMHCSEEQLRLLDESPADAERVAAVMRQKKGIMDALIDLEEEHRSLKDEWGRDYAAIPEPLRAGVKERLGGIGDRLARLKEMEERIGERLRECGAEVDRRLRLLERGKKLNRAYHNPPRGNPRFIDTLK